MLLLFNNYGRGLSILCCELYVDYMFERCFLFLSDILWIKGVIVHSLCVIGFRVAGSCFCVSLGAREVSWEILGKIDCSTIDLRADDCSTLVINLLDFLRGR